MTDKNLKLEIITPEKIVFSNPVDHVKAPGYNGYFGVKPEHIPFLTVIKTGNIKAEMGKENKCFAVCGGFVQVTGNTMLILAEAAEDAASIDLERAQRARDRAMKRLQEKAENTDIPRAKAALLRALNRLEVAKM
ncbi:MAG TPA: F0F1 ATP synthase subunit epsilon [bacterium]|nr:F0F1 ATP synthase subunit epsilon [bacterium]HPN42664.1 F0F1 ATP synthase subunit epsilon [bacterium]